jgi:hypothetical membrane protein
MKLRLSRVVLPAAAVSLFVAAVTVFGAAAPGYAQRLHPVGLLGARGASGAAVFNALAFVAPGLLLACVAWALRDRAHGWASRIGSQLVLLSALALAAQGLLPLDPTDFDHADSQRHAVAWTAWWLAFAAGCLPISSETPRAGWGSCRSSPGGCGSWPRRLDTWRSGRCRTITGESHSLTGNPKRSGRRRGNHVNRTRPRRHCWGSRIRHWRR